MTIDICADHAGLEYKTRLIQWLSGNGFVVINFRTDSPESCDYLESSVITYTIHPTLQQTFPFLFWAAPNALQIPAILSRLQLPLQQFSLLFSY